MGEGLWGSTVDADDRRDPLQGLACLCRRDTQLPVLAAPLPGVPRGGTQPGLWGFTSKASGLGVALSILSVPVTTPSSAG